jgi:hypothetical protein
MRDVVNMQLSITAMPGERRMKRMGIDHLLERTTIQNDSVPHIFLVGPKEIELSSVISSSSFVQALESRSACEQEPDLMEMGHSDEPLLTTPDACIPQILHRCSRINHKKRVGAWTHRF